jgi:hypothetical protein
MLAEVYLMRLRTLVGQPGRDTIARNSRFVPYVPIKLDPPLVRRQAPVGIVQARIRAARYFGKGAA